MEEVTQSGEVLIRFSDDTLLSEMQRACSLAEAIGGRYSRRESGFYFTPVRAAKFRLLFATGFKAHASPEKYRRTFGRSNWERVRLSGAVEIAKELALLEQTSGAEKPLENIG